MRRFSDTLLAFVMSHQLYIYFPTLRLFSSFDRDTLFPLSRRLQKTPTSEGIGSSLLARKKMENIASAVARAAKRRQATTAVPLSAPLCWDSPPRLCTYAK